MEIYIIHVHIFCFDANLQICLGSPLIIIQMKINI